MIAHPHIISQSLFQIPEVRATCDTHLATIGYYNQIGGTTPLDECDRIYETHRPAWLPTKAEFESQRAASAIHPSVLDLPVERKPRG